MSDLTLAVAECLEHPHQMPNLPHAPRSRADVSSEARDPHGEWTSGGGDSAKAKPSKSELAKASYKPSTAAKQRKGEAEQARLATMIGIKGLDNTEDNAPFDLLSKQAHIGVEVKTLIDNNNDKITMHPESRQRKLAFAAKNHLTTHTVAIDTRGGKRAYYYRAGLGSFTLSGMQKIGLAELREKLMS